MRTIFALVMLVGLIFSLGLGSVYAEDIKNDYDGRKKTAADPEVQLNYESESYKPQKSIPRIPDPNSSSKSEPVMMERGEPDFKTPEPQCVCAECGKKCGSGHASNCPYKKK